VNHEVHAGPATRWWWVRHAPVVVNEGKVYGQIDHPCDCGDRPTFQALAQLLPKDAVWITSSLQRTRQTAEAILAESGERPALLVEPELMEQNFGERQGKLYRDVRSPAMGDWHRFWSSPLQGRVPGGESFADLCERTARCVRRLSSAHVGRDIVAVAHGGSIRAALVLALGLSTEAAVRLVIDNCALTRIDLVPGPLGSHAPHEAEAWQVRFVNLAPELALTAAMATTPA